MRDVESVRALECSDTADTILWMSVFAQVDFGGRQVPTLKLCECKLHYFEAYQYKVYW